MRGFSSGEKYVALSFNRLTMKNIKVLANPS